jgi:hypothetical protein
MELTRHEMNYLGVENVIMPNKKKIELTSHTLFDCLDYVIEIPNGFEKNNTTVGPVRNVRVVKFAHGAKLYNSVYATQSVTFQFMDKLELTHSKTLYELSKSLNVHLATNWCILTLSTRDRLNELIEVHVHPNNFGVSLSLIRNQ